MTAPFGFTALTTPSLLATKKFKLDPLTGGISEEGYGKAKHFKLRPVTFADLDDLYVKLNLLLAEPRTFIVRGAPLPDVNLSWAVRRLGPEPDEPATFGACPRAWIMLDIDWRPAPMGIDPVVDSDDAAAFIVRHLPPDLDDVVLIVAWGSSQGIKAEKFSAHVFALLDSPVPDEDLRRWAKFHRDRLPIDPSVFNPVQAHYTAAPVFVGLPDPLVGRRFVRVDRGRRTASLVIPPPPPPRTPEERKAGIGACHGYEAHRARIGTADGFHGPLVSAVGAYVHEHGPRGTDIDALISDLAVAVIEADPGGRSVDEVTRYAGDKFLRELITSILRKDEAADPRAAPSTGPYDVQHGRIVFKRTTSDGEVETVHLTNFNAKILEDITIDDGATRELFFEIEGALDTGATLPAVQVSAAKFQSMTWPSASWGSDVVVFSGRDGKDRVRDAIQRLSLTGKKRRTVYRHTGWRKLDGAWVYLHAGGGIDANGVRSDVEVQLQGGLAHVSLPPPPEDLKELIRRILVALPGPPRISLVLLAAMARAILVEVVQVVFSIFLLGATGRFKTEVATIFQQFFGATFSPQALPGNFSSTANSLERLIFIGKDCLVTLDEYCPKGTGTREANELHAKGERIFRSVANVAPRERLTAEAQLRSGYPPRGLVVATGEDLPRGQSLLARILVIEFGDNDITPGALTEAQLLAPEFSKLTAGFIQWLSPRIDDLKATAPAKLRELRNRARAGAPHARTPDITASLYLGLDTMATFFVEVGGLTEEEGETLGHESWDALIQVASAQAKHLRASDPVTRFDKLLTALFAAARAHLLDAATGQRPSDSVAWGWRERKGTDSFGDVRLDWSPQGVPLGYLRADGGIYLEWEVTYALLQKLALEQGETLSLSSYRMLTVLEERGRLHREEHSDKFSVRFTPPGGKARARYILITPTPGGAPPGKTGPTGPTGPTKGPEPDPDPSPRGVSTAEDTMDTFVGGTLPHDPGQDQGGGVVRTVSTPE